MTGEAAERVNFSNVQGLVMQPYRLKRSRHALFAFSHGCNSKGFLRALLPHITTGMSQIESATDACFNIALSHAGLARLGQEDAFLNRLDPMLIEGPQATSLGDVIGSASDPANWWEQQFTCEQIHCLLQIHARDAVTLDAGVSRIAELAARFGLTELIPRRDGTRLDGQGLPGGKVHFGYKDGLSQPDVAWNGVVQNNQVHFRHFLLGYASEDVFSSPSSGATADILRDSSYLVLRWVYQDVAAFNGFLRTQAPLLAPHLSVHDAEELLAAKLVGRWRDGTPLVLSPDRPSAEVPNDANYSFRDQDPDGHRCPFSAHTRICNPRDQALDPTAATEGVPRVIRRGMPYGPEFDSDRAVDDGVDRGLIGVFICSSIRRQFYTLTRWLTENSFSPVFAPNRHTQDPLVGNRAYPDAANEFRIPTAGASVTLKGLPSFVRTKGTAFFVLPSVNALAHLARE